MLVITWQMATASLHFSPGFKDITLKMTWQYTKFQLFATLKRKTLL
jgi:hypothetical protein